MARTARWPLAFCVPPCSANTPAIAGAVPSKETLRARRRTIFGAPTLRYFPKELVRFTAPGRCRAAYGKDALHGGAALISLYVTYDA